MGNNDIKNLLEWISSIIEDTPDDWEDHVTHGAELTTGECKIILSALKCYISHENS